MPVEARPRRRLAPAALAFALALFVGLSGAARADVVWQVSSVHGDQHMAPGGQGQFLLQAFDIGDAPTTTPYTVTDTLPAGVTVHSLAQIPSDVTHGGSWDCSGTTFPDAGIVTCTSSTMVLAPGPALLARGAARPLALTVDVAGDASGTLANHVTVSGGSATATPAAVDDPTVLDATPAGFGFVPGSFAADVFDAPFPAGAPVRQAGSHPFELRVDFDLDLKLASDPAAGGALYTKPDESLRTLEAKLPAGMIGNPAALPQCDPTLLSDANATNFGRCPANTQVGSIDLFLQNGSELQDRNAVTDVPVFNVVPAPGVVAELALTFVGNPVFVTITLDPTDRYSVLATISDTTELLALRSARLTLWGVPADPAHDALRVDPDAALFGVPFADAPIRPFLTLPSECGADGAVQIRADSWQHPDDLTPWTAAATARMAGCGDPRARFDPSVSVAPTVRTPATPTGLDVLLTLPQKDDRVVHAADLYAGSGVDAAIATPPLRDLTVLLPPGMTVSPSAADGLLACSSAQIGLGSNADPACPDASKIGTATIVTPLLADSLQGSVYLASQSDNPFGSLLALYLVATGPGVVVKLPGLIVPDAHTGQLQVSFQDTPQVPVSSVRVQLKSGARAPLVTPAACGTYTTTATLTSWNGALPAVQRQSSFAIDGGGGSGAAAACAPRGFDPGFTAGTTVPVAGRDSPIVAAFTRGDRDQELGSVAATLPRGLLGRVADVVLCSDGDANAGTCGAASRIGGVTVAAGPGPDPFSIADGGVYVTGPYEGAPFGLSVVVHAKAGPFDLGLVVVRAQVQVDRTTAALRVVSDPLPTILDGIPLQLRLAAVTIDRARFAFNPTNCDPMSASARIVSTEGAVASRSERFQVADCGALPFKPAIAFAVGARGHTRLGVSTPLTATVRMGRGQANIRSVSVTLPGTLTALLPVVTNACTLDAFHAGRCEQARAGTAVAVSPLLRDPLRGGVYFVKNGRPLPDLMIALRGQVAVDLDGTIAVPGGKRLRARFDAVPDVPIASFTLRFASGTHGPIGVARNLCTSASRRATVAIAFVAQSGKRLDVSRQMRVAGCARVAKP